MKNIRITLYAVLFGLLGHLYAQLHVSSRFVLTSNYVKWGSTIDTVGTDSIRYFSGGFQRDSAGTWIASDSCSLPVQVNNDLLMGMTYELRGIADSTNITDTATRIKIQPYVRNCQWIDGTVNGHKRYLACDTYVKSLITGNSAFADSTSINRSFFGSDSAKVGVQAGFSTLEGNSVKLCVTNGSVNKTTGKFLSFHAWVLRGGN